MTTDVDSKVDPAFLSGEGGAGQVELAGDVRPGQADGVVGGQVWEAEGCADRAFVQVEWSGQVCAVDVEAAGVGSKVRVEQDLAEVVGVEFPGLLRRVA
ncbi:hypothetical protein EFY87_17905 [Flexivirga caeni]|uniref:Uncharacterized protein n=1 Tax=Flexivirga caeni TaxID=2294115 RepID=A0A3M9M073_9MICO|nr:hypothetical protein EFY87_17905 [Flexivirga caeni]